MPRKSDGAAKVNYGSLPFHEQIAYFRSKANVSSERWADIWKEAHNRSFMVAGAMKEDLLADFRKAVDTSISEGKSLGWFKSQFNNIVAKHGWEHAGAASWRAQVIYETNIRQSYTAGREQQIEQVKQRRPYGIYKHSGSEHPRHDHLSWNNLVLPLDDPWWKAHTPINGYGCKCRKLTLSERDLKRLGLEVSPSPKVQHYEWVDKVTGEVHNLPKGIDPGFDYTPKTSEELTQKTKAAIERKPSLNERLTPRVVDHAYSTIRGVNAPELSRILGELANPQIDTFEKVLKTHDIKTLFIKAGEMSSGKKALAIADNVQAYLQTNRPPQFNFTTRRPSRTNGFTSKRYNHVVVKAKSTDRLSSVTAEQIKTAVIEAIEQPNGRVFWSFSDATKTLSGDSARVVATWAHEMGHQVYFKAGSPTLPAGVSNSITRYGSRDDDEWFAEHFVAWLFAPEQLKNVRPDAYAFITDTVNKSI